MTEDHERIEELLAGHAVGALDGADRAEADRLLVEHVPTCETCLETLQPFLEVAGDLALAAPPADPPELVWRRLRREVLTPPATRRRRPAWAWSAAVAASVAVIGLAAWNTALNSRLSNEAQRQQHLTQAMSAIADPAARKVRLDSATEPHPMEAAYTSHEAHLSIVGVGIPDPAPGHVYRVWLLGLHGDVRAGDFVPDDGLVIITLSVDPTQFTKLEITEERNGPPGRAPSGQERWSTAL